MQGDFKEVIRSKKEKPMGTVEIDLAGPEGNAYALCSVARTIGRKLGYSESRIAAIYKVMMMGDYEGLVKVFDREFGHIVTLWR